MEILGVGNAIVDVICKVDDDFISKNRPPPPKRKNIKQNGPFLGGGGRK